MQRVMYKSFHYTWVGWAMKGKYLRYVMKGKALFVWEIQDLHIESMRTKEKMQRLWHEIDEVS